jgi:Reverse transcriptase (RNA-dependent DNA polymerase)
MLVSMLKRFSASSHHKLILPSLFYHLKLTSYISLSNRNHIIITGSSASAIQDLMKALATQFSIKDLGTLFYFLDIELTHSSITLQLTQTSYLESILQKANMQGAKTCATLL